MKEVLLWSLENKLESILVVFGLMLFLWMWWQYENRCITVTRYGYRVREDLQGLKGFKILQISDLHSTMFGREQADLIAKIKDQNPDLIFITGDLIDRSDGRNLEAAETLIGAIHKLCPNEGFDMGYTYVPVFYVTGNHEIGYKYSEYLDDLLAHYNLSVLNNEFVDLKINDCPKIRIIGVMDWGFQLRNDLLTGDDWHKWMNDNMLGVFRDLKDKSEHAFNILLSHRPEKFDIYLRSGVDLVFTGHAHGGQIRLPFLGSILAPNQGFFQKYVEGMHTQTYHPKEYEDDERKEETTTSMIVNRGLGGTKKFPTRINNRPEIVVLEFE